MQSCLSEALWPCICSRATSCHWCLLVQELMALAPPAVAAGLACTCRELRRLYTFHEREVLGETSGQVVQAIVPHYQAVAACACIKADSGNACMQPKLFCKRLSWTTACDRAMCDCQRAAVTFFGKDLSIYSLVSGIHKRPLVPACIVCCF